MPIKVPVFIISFFLIFQNSYGLTDSKGGMPQLDPSSFESQIFWLFIIFSVLFILINFFFLPELKIVRNERTNLIKENLEVADKNNNEIDKINEIINLKLQEAEHDCQKIIKIQQLKQTKYFNQELEKQLNEFENKENKILKDLEKSIEDIEKNIGVYAKNLSNSIYFKILNEKKDLSKSELDSMKGLL